MFSTNLCRRPTLQSLVPHLQSSQEPVFKECPSLTHDLALPIGQFSPATTQSVSNPQRGQFAQTSEPQRYHLFLLLTPDDLDSANEQATLQRIARFSTLTASPIPTIALVLYTDLAGSSTSPTATPTLSTSVEGMNTFMRLQTLLHVPPNILKTETNKNNITVIDNVLSTLTPIPILPIPNTSTVLSILKSYTSPTPNQSLTRQPQNQALHHLLPHITSGTIPLSQHTVNVLSDLCHSIREVAWICEREEGREMLQEWIGEEAEEIMGFWAKEWTV